MGGDGGGGGGGEGGGSKGGGEGGGGKGICGLRMGKGGGGEVEVREELVSAAVAKEQG